jgi:hypothetical protein
MDELTLEKEKTKLEKYLVKQGRQDFVNEMDAADVTQLDSRLLGLAKHAQEIANTKANDVELDEAKRAKKDLEAPYRDQLKMNKKLARYVALVMQEKTGQ